MSDGSERVTPSGWSLSSAGGTLVKRSWLASGLCGMVCACGVGASVAEGQSFSTVELKTNFLGTVREGGAVTGRAWPAHRGRTTQVWDAEIGEEATGKVVALFRCT